MSAANIKLDHINILVEDWDQTVAFYHQIFGFIEGKHVANGRHNYLYTADGTRAFIHLSSLASKIRYNSDPDQAYKIDATLGPQNTHTGALDHIAFLTDEANFKRIITILQEQKTPYRIDIREQDAQAWFFDPNGVKLEVTYKN